MTSFLLIRHAQCDAVGKSIVGRLPGIHLNEAGRREAERLADRLDGVALAGLYSSPLERALETARPIGIRQNLPVQALEELNEIDFGDWTGRSLAELDQLPDWRRFNSFRSGGRIPGGENMAEVLARALQALDRMRQLHPNSGEIVGVVSHGDVLRLLVAHALGSSLDLMQRFELSPASLSILDLESYGPRLLLLNSTDGWPDGFPSRKAR
jgi:broad specificity phosphatase PhoE